MYKTTNRMTLSVMIAASLFLFSACHSPRVEPVKTLPPSVQLKRILVTPFMDMYSVYGENVAYTCPVRGYTRVIGVVADEADDYMSRRV